MDEVQRLTPLETYIAALERASEHCSTLAAALRGVRTEDQLLQKSLLDTWVDLTDKLDKEQAVIQRGQQQYQQWAIRRYEEKQERATFRLPSYQR